jgi:hypothetical protein
VGSAGSSGSGVDPARLRELHAAVRRARSDVDAARSGIGNTQEIRAAQVVLLASLERLEDVLTAAGLTLPHEVRREIDFLRQLLGTGHGPVHRTW